ncbi:MAG: AEC family transporter [Alphaproteobacteria bacterium]|nr:AEC family transporter [Alphaproteobacteria bacterium]
MTVLINVVFPVFAIIAAGYLAGRFRVLGPESAVALNRFVYYFALPPVLFAFPARQPIADVLNGPFIAAFLAGAALTLALAFAANRLWLRHRPDMFALYSLNAIYPNTSYMGIPLFLTAFGKDGAMPAIVATLLGIALMVGATIATLEASRASGSSALRVVRQVTGVLVRNPLLIAIAAGMAASVLQLPIPTPIGNFLDLMASAAGPAALFALGLSLTGFSLLSGLGEVGWVTLLKLGVQPLCTWVMVRYVFDVAPGWAEGAVILAGLPVGAVAFVIAQQYDCYTRRTSSLIIVTTGLSVLTTSALLILLGVG